MNKCNLSKIMLVLALVVMGTLSTYAQNNGDADTTMTKINTPTEFEFTRYVYLSGDFGLGILRGENTSNKLGYNGHIGIGYQFDKYVGLKANIGYGSLNGGFENITINKLNYLETNINLTFDLTHIIFGYKPDRKFKAIPHIGFGQIQYRLDALNNNGDAFNQIGFNDVIDSENGGFSGRKVIATVPLGLELDYAIGKRWSLFFDITATYTDGDLIDGFNGDYINDWYLTMNIGANYKLANVPDRRVRATRNGQESEQLITVNANCSNYWYVTVDGGASFLFGDNKSTLSSMEGNYNVGVGYNFGDYYRIYGKIGKGGISGQERDRHWAIIDGNSLQASLNVSADIIGLITKNTDKRLELYPHIGIGQMQYRTTTSVYKEGLVQYGYKNNNDYNTEGEGFNGRVTTLTVPVGIELAYNVTDRTDLYADATSYLTQTDLLDCIKSGKRRDAYSTFNVGLRYKFNKSCVEPEPCCITPEEVEEAVQNALEQQKAEEEKPASCITPEELKQAIKDAIDEYEASRPKDDGGYGSLSKATVINNNYSDISFPQNLASKIKTQTNIDAINRASSQVEDGSAVNRVIIEGYASPEGTKDFNERLARERAEQAAKIIQNELGEIDAERIEITTKGADWDGLYASLENSDIEDKNEIIEKLKSSENPEETMKEILKSHPQVRELLPQLRRASIVITTVK